MEQDLALGPVGQIARSVGVEFTNAPHIIHRHEDGTEEWMAFFRDNEERPLAIMSKVSPSLSVA